MQRRSFLHLSLLTSSASLLASMGILAPRQAQAEASGAFAAKTLDDTLKALSVTPEASDKIKINAPEIAEDGSVVPVTVTSQLDGTTEMSIIVENNPIPLAATFSFGEGVKAEASTRLKMGKTSNVLVLAKVGDKTYSAKQEVKVTIGGCGG